MTTDKEQFRTLEDQIESTLLDARRLFFTGAVTGESASDAIRKLWYLELKESGKPILFVINSPGGSVYDGLAIWDQVGMIKSPVITLVTGLAASMGSVLSLCAAKGKRYATKNARFMIHQPSIPGQIQGQATDLEIHAKEIVKTKNMLVELYMQQSGRKREDIEAALDRDTWMTAEETKNFGLLDKVVTSFDDIK